ncbi:MAG: tetratricopeptide repeat protein [Acidobacteria bacterium]|nr:tetratricopeptide repeat protein [Acidobacteriota bacterium]
MLLAVLPLAGAVPSAAQPSADLAARAQRGQAAMNAGRFDEAARIYGELVQAVPGEAGLRLNLGMALSMAGRPREARPHLEAALESGRPELVPAALFLGSVYLELGQPARAVEPLETFLAAQPGNREARRMLADALLHLERHGEAARHYRRLTEQAPEDPGAWFGLGRSYEGLSQKAFEELGTLAPESPEILLLVAEALVAQERDKRAFQLYREALDKRPGLAEAHEALGEIYERGGHPDWAAAERAKVRSLPPPDCASARLECDFEAGRYVEVVAAARSLQTAEGRYWLSRAAGELARDAFSRLEGLGPSPEATLVEVQVLRSQRRYAESKEALQKAEEAWPGDLRIRQELAKLLFIGREYEAARPLLEELLSRQPDSPEAHLLLGELWVEQRKPEEAIPHLEKAAVAGPLQLRARAALGRAYVDAGQAEKAIPHLEAALPTDEDGSLRFQLARAYQATGQTDRAREMRQEFQEIQRSQERTQEEDLVLTPP